MNAKKPSLIGRLLAEFLVVVIGVLVALGVDEWRGTLTERSEESLYYERLAEDFAADIANWEQLIQLLTPKDDALARVQEWMLEPSLSDRDRLQELAQDLAMGAVYSGSVPPPRRSTYEELLSTGKIAVIRDSRFRAALIDYQFAFDNLFVRVSSRITGYERLAYSIVPREIRGTGDNFARSDLTELELRSVAQAVRESDELGPLVGAERNRTGFLRSEFEALISSAQGLMEQANAPPAGPST